MGHQNGGSGQQVANEPARQYDQQLTTYTDSVVKAVFAERFANAKKLYLSPAYFTTGPAKRIGKARLTPVFGLQYTNPNDMKNVDGDRRTASISFVYVESEDGDQVAFYASTGINSRGEETFQMYQRQGLLSGGVEAAKEVILKAEDFIKNEK